jgi:hypothetical protein
MKKTAIDRFNDSRQEESHRLNLKRKVEHDEKMASIRLKRHKYDLRYGTGTPQAQTPGFSTPVTVLATAAATKEDKQIEILHLQIRLAELTRDSSAHASLSYTSSQMPHHALGQASLSRNSSSQIHHASKSSSQSHISSSQMRHNSLQVQVEEVSTPSSGMSSLSYLSGHSHNGFVDNNFMTSKDPGSYHHDVSSAEASSVGVDNWPETYDFTE